MTATRTTPLDTATMLHVAVGEPLGSDELRRIDAYWRAANYLSVGQIYLMGNPLLREPLQPGARQAAAARALGHHAGPEPALRPPVPDHRRPRPGGHLRDRPGPRWPRAGRQHLAGGHLHARSTRGSRRTRSGMQPAVHASSPSPAASRHMSRRRRPGRSTRAASWATRCRTPTARRWTTPTSSWPASSATARPRPARWPPPGTRTSSSTRSATARCCRSCTSTATRSPTRRSWPASATTNSAALLTGYGYQPVPGRRRRSGHRPPAPRRHPGRRLRRDRRDPAGRPRGRGHRPSTLADDRAADPQGLDRTARSVDGLPVEGTWRAHQVPLSAARDDPAHLAPLETWMRSYRPEELFDADGAPRP